MGMFVPILPIGSMKKLYEECGQGLGKNCFFREEGESMNCLDRRIQIRTTFAVRSCGKFDSFIQRRPWVYAYVARKFVILVSALQGLPLKILNVKKP